MGLSPAEYEYDADADIGLKSIRQVDWTHKGEWTFKEKLATKILKNISDYTKDVSEFNSLFEDPIDQELEYPEYNKKSFLEEVFLSEEEYDLLVNLLKHKQNIILQVPRYRKTFAAKRLAYSIMGIKIFHR